MATWLMGHRDRSAAGVSTRSVNDFVSEIGASGLGWFLNASCKRSTPMTRAASCSRARRCAPRSRSPHRCWWSTASATTAARSNQGEQLFTILRRLGRTDAEFVRFTDTGHEMSRSGKPRSRILRLRAIAHWFIRHLKPASINAIPADAGSLFAPLPGEE